MKINLNIPQSQIVDEGPDYIVIKPPKRTGFIHNYREKIISVTDITTGEVFYDINHINKQLKNITYSRPYFFWTYECVKYKLKSLIHSINPLCLKNVEIDLLEGRISSDISLRAKNLSEYFKGVTYQNILWHILFGCPEGCDAYIWAKKKLSILSKWFHQIYEKISMTKIGQYMINSFKKIKFGELDINASWNYQVHNVPSLVDFMKNLVRYLTSNQLRTYNGFDVKIRYTLGDRTFEVRKHINIEATLPAEGEVKIWK